MSKDQFDFEVFILLVEKDLAVSLSAFSYFEAKADDMLLTQYLHWFVGHVRLQEWFFLHVIIDERSLFQEVTHLNRRVLFLQEPR